MDSQVCLLSTFFLFLFFFCESFINVWIIDYKEYATSSVSNPEEVQDLSYISEDDCVLQQRSFRFWP
ncbi:hypothetical protein QVD17_06559 [Tagetes erecta]|uniref:Uncharacterized protein n=1 Tax=Tagetes erecta TaxID=13708 RepID=A0AAD8LG81_TARER|nr:hypothetical protein QVD17_06559 [Tagetes erecta]